MTWRIADFNTNPKYCLREENYDIEGDVRYDSRQTSQSRDDRASMNAIPEKNDCMPMERPKNHRPTIMQEMHANTSTIQQRHSGNIPDDDRILPRLYSQRNVSASSITSKENYSPSLSPKTSIQTAVADTVPPEGRDANTSQMLDDEWILSQLALRLWASQIQPRSSSNPKLRLSLFAVRSCRRTEPLPPPHHRPFRAPSLLG